MKKRKLFIRIVAIIMAGLMAAGMGFMVIEMLFLG